MLCGWNSGSVYPVLCWSGVCAVGVQCGGTVIVSMRFCVGLGSVLTRCVVGGNVLVWAVCCVVRTLVVSL